VSPVLQAGVLADLLVVLVPGQVHAQDRVVVVGGELRPGRVDQLLDQVLDVDAALLEFDDANPFAGVAWLGLAGRVRLGWRARALRTCCHADLLEREKKATKTCRPPATIAHGRLRTRFLFRNDSRPRPPESCLPSSVPRP